MLDAHGIRLIELCKSTNLLIANGRLHHDNSICEYTFISHNGISVVDDLLINYNDFQYITNFKTLDPNELSDHNALFFWYRADTSDSTITCPKLHPRVIFSVG